MRNFEIELCTDDATLFVEDQASDLDTLPAWGILRCLRVVKGSVRGSNGDALLSIGHTLAVRVEALEKQDLIRCHILLVVKSVVLVRRYTHSLSLYLITLSRVVFAGIREDLLAAVIIISVLRVSSRVHEIGSNEVRGRRGPPVDDGKRVVRCRALNWSPDIDDLVTALHELICLFLGNVAADTNFGCRWSLVNVDLLYGLACGVFDSPANGVVKDVDFLDPGNLVAEQLLDLRVVAVPYSSVVCERPLLGGILVDSEPRVVGVVFMFSAAQVVDLTRMALAFEVLARSVHLGPWLSCIGVGVDVDEVGCRHIEQVCCALMPTFQPELRSGICTRAVMLCFVIAEWHHRLVLAEVTDVSQSGAQGDRRRRGLHYLTCSV